ncbi:LysM peptidoglycan-binding domain-containing protein [Chitinophaga pendula]|uniref:LysM peptidoglycan-binding domain-containing protein n=1 Tax=Chitinophaga TaxID=79328 RepID=UPI000BB0B259|nr:MULTISPECIES: LysM peptidoglycan-binding domain-containing protein [Chitinophaga]ASZ10569.1 peptidoglycan-binding protein [Chitinophaga sp. MD30]UCJ06457.1 LysM peptidoglycan-binding domain-containing protein [Chitinophaga pendula]
MGLQDKYQELINQANSAGVSGLQVTEKDGVLYVNGTAPSAQIKDQLWDTYEKLDPEMRAADLVLNINLAAGAGGGEQEYEVKSGDNLSKIAKNYPGVSWQDIFEANKDQIKDPNLIKPGQKLKIPSA